MNKTEELKKAMKSPPPERLAAIEYRSHFLQILGVLFVCAMLFLNGLWYVIFALIFGVGVSYSQGMTAYQKYKTIMAFRKPESIEQYDLDISPTRRRSKIINHVLGKNGMWISAVLAVAIPLFFLDLTMNRWLLSLAYLTFIIFFYLIIYFFLMYSIAFPFYRREIEMKEVNKK